MTDRFLWRKSVPAWRYNYLLLRTAEYRSEIANNARYRLMGEELRDRNFTHRHKLVREYMEHFGAPPSNITGAWINHKWLDLGVIRRILTENDCWLDVDASIKAIQEYLYDENK